MSASSSSRGEAIPATEPVLRHTHLSQVLAANPGRWSRPAIAAAATFARDLPEATWPTVLDEIDAAISSVSPEQTAGERASSVMPVLCK
jgi:hypothetical protein